MGARAAAAAAAVAALALAACGGGDGGAPAVTAPPGAGAEPAPDAITEAHAGATFALRAGDTVPLRLTSDVAWTGAEVDGGAVVLSPVDYFQDPGFREWEVRAVAPGTATVRAEGDGREPFEVVLVVGR